MTRLIAPAPRLLHRDVRRFVRLCEGLALLASILSRIGLDGRDESIGLAITVTADACESQGLVSSQVMAELADIAHYGDAIDVARRADDLIWDRRAEDSFAPPAEWLGAAVSRRCHAVFAKDAPKWLACLADEGNDAPAELVRFVVDRLDSLQWSRPRLLVDPRLDHADLDGPSIRNEGIGVAIRAAILLGIAEPDEEVLGPDIQWLRHLPAFEAGLPGELLVLLRASATIHARIFGPGEPEPRDIALAIELFEREKVMWLRFVADSEAFMDFDAIPGLLPSTRCRLETLLDLAQSEDDEQIRTAGWVTRWHEASR